MSRKGLYALVILVLVVAIAIIFWLGYSTSSGSKDKNAISDDPGVREVKQDIPRFAELMSRDEAFFQPMFNSPLSQSKWEEMFAVFTDGDAENRELTNVRLHYPYDDYPRITFTFIDNKRIYAEIANTSDGDRLIRDLQQFFSAAD